MLVPQLIVRDVPEAIAFYTEVLDFRLVLAMGEGDPFYAILMHGADEMHLQRTPGQGRYGHCAVIVLCDDVDAAFASFVARGLKPSERHDSPVHQAPLDQSWGTREVYVDDPSDNTVIFQQR